METALYWIGRAAIALISCWPLKLIAWLGRRGGGLAWRLDRRHRTVALENLTAAFPEKSETEIRQLARQHFQRLGETYACIIKTGGMGAEDINNILTIEGFDKIEKMMRENPDEKIILAIGHFGQFELFLWLKLAVPSARHWITTYRGLRQRKLTELLLGLRRASGAIFFDRRTEGDQLKKALREPSTVLGLLADQHAGTSSLRLPVLGRIASVSAAPAVMAQRYGCRLFPSVCFRTAPGRWTMELGAEIPLRENGKRRATEAITRDLIAAQDEYIRRDPANWFWVHNRWKDLSQPAVPEP